MHSMSYVSEMLFGQEHIVTLMVTALTFNLQCTVAHASGVSVHTVTSWSIMRRHQSQDSCDIKLGLIFIL